MSDIELSNETSVSNSKRGRGRPKKQLNNGVTNSTDNVKNGNNYDAKQTKKRGRKPKNDNTANNDAVSDGDGGVDGGVTAPTTTKSIRNAAKAKSKTKTAKSGAKRGAKRSLSAANANPTTTAAKRRGRGRPPKSQKTAASNVDESTPNESEDEEIGEDED